MKTLVSTRNAALQQALVQALVAHNHEVRVLLNDAPDRTTAWPSSVEPYLGRPGDPATLTEAVHDCDVVIAVNNDALIEAAAQMGTARVIHLVPQNNGLRSDSFPGEWLTIRSAPLYGTGDDALTLMLVMMRSLPVVPLLSEQHVWQPVWYRDVAEALAVAAELPESAVNRTVDIAGPETLTHREMYERIAGLIDRRPTRIPVPTFLASYGTRLSKILQTTVPFEEQSAALFDSDASHPVSTENALANLFGVTPTALNDGLRRLVQELEEMVPAQGIGSLEVKRFSADIRDGEHSAATLLCMFRERFKDVMPVEVGVEPITPEVELIQGAVLTITLPGRGHVPIRVEDVTNHQVVIATLRGHVVAGIVRFCTRDLDDDAVRFEVMTCDTAPNRLDWLGHALGGARLQDANWSTVVQNVVSMSGGAAGAVRSDARTLSGEEADHIGRWIDALIHHQRASAHAMSGRAGDECSESSAVDSAAGRA